MLFEFPVILAGIGVVWLAFPLFGPSGGMIAFVMALVAVLAVVEWSAR